jgi:hypothetical protein
VAALFSRSADLAFRIATIALVLLVAALIATPMVCIRTPYADARYVPVEQPIQFDHRHHARDDGIDCLYCHPGAENNAQAGIPATDVCMGCHGQVWRDSPHLEPVRRSFADGAAISWVRVHDLPDFVYFHHGVHVRRGIECRRCHGDVENMARVMRVSDLTMGWCLDCHRNPPGPENHGRSITALTTCTACHR